MLHTALSPSDVSTGTAFRRFVCFLFFVAMHENSTDLNVKRYQKAKRVYIPVFNYVRNEPDGSLF